MSDFKWEMQERIDQGMSPDDAYNATRDAHAEAWDNRDKTAPRDTHSVHVKHFECDPDESGGLADER